MNYSEIEWELNEAIQQDIFSDGPEFESMQVDVTWGRESLSLDTNPYIIQVKPKNDNGHLEKLEPTIPEQKSAQKSIDQHEIERGGPLKIQLNRKVSGWIGVILLHSNTKFQKNRLTDMDGSAAFKIDADDSDMLGVCQPIEKIGCHFLQAIKLLNQDNFNLVIKVDSSNKCSKFFVITIVCMKLIQA